MRSSSSASDEQVGRGDADTSVMKPSTIWVAAASAATLIASTTRQRVRERRAEHGGEAFWDMPPAQAHPPERKSRVRVLHRSTRPYR